jgi:hypothetical protein
MPVDDFNVNELNPPQYNDQKCPSEHSSNKDQQGIFNQNADLFPFTMGSGLGLGLGGYSNNLLYN